METIPELPYYEDAVVYTSEQHPCAVCGFMTTRTNRYHEQPSCSTGCDNAIFDSLEAE